MRDHGVPQEMRDLCKERVKIHRGQGQVPAAVAERLRALEDELDAIGLTEGN